jgi:hypothetical protein
MQAELQAEYQLRRAHFLSLILQSPPTSVDRPLIDFALAITMPLLNTLTLKLKQYIKDIPPYAILSHTWGDEEVTFDDIDKPCATSIKEYQKIRGSCELVRKDGFEWIWVDTCCIDKKSSETSEQPCIAVWLERLKDGRCARLPETPLKNIKKARGIWAKVSDVFIETNMNEVAFEDLEQYLIHVSNLQIWDYPDTNLESICIMPIRYKSTYGSRQPPTLAVTQPNAREGSVLYGKDCSVTIVHINGLTMGIMFGNHRYSTYLRLLLLDRESDYAQLAERYYEDMLATDNVKSKYTFRDHLEESCQDLTVSVFARRMRRSGKPAWQLSIRIWNTAAGAPDEKSTTSRKCLALA